MYHFVVYLIHALVLAWAVISPFSRWKYLRLTYVIFAPFLMLHWLMNNDTCALTTIECTLRGLDDCSESFIHKVVSPIYKISDSTARTVAWTFTVVSWAYAASTVTMDDVVSFFTT